MAVVVAVRAEGDMTAGADGVHREDRDQPFVSVVELFEREAARQPDRPALVGEDNEMTYAQLEQKSSNLAQALCAVGVDRRAPVAVLVDRGATQLMALLGVLRAGAPYMCIDTDQPMPRIEARLRDSGATVLVTGAETGGLPSFTGRVLLAEDPQPPVLRVACPVIEPGDVAYVLYTSGSSGEPKGVAVTHGGLSNYTRFMMELLDCTQPQNTATVTSLATDLGNTAVYPALCSGGCVHVIPAEVARDPIDFGDYMQANAIDILKITPSHLSAMLDDPDSAVLPARVLVLGGEAVQWELVDTVRGLTTCRIINHYGPTETTVGSLTHEVNVSAEGYRAGPTVPIGRPIANTGAHVVDELLRPVPTEAAGELLISGAGLASGYWASEQLTSERFVTGFDGARAYRTGDRVRRLSDGTIEFLGRMDSQVKIRGHRVEPGEVEAALRLDPQVLQAAVVPMFDDSGAARLVAYVVARAKETLLPPKLRQRLRELLPAYLVPAEIVVLEELPVTPSGKLDRSTLATRGGRS